MNRRSYANATYHHGDAMIFKPRGPFQVNGIGFLVANSFAGLFWDPGRGKTITFLQAFKILRDTGFVKRTLVLASVNIIHDVWPEEIEKFDDLDLTYSIVHGKKKEQAMELDADVYLMNYESLPWFRSTYGKFHDIDMLGVDESGKFRNRGAKTLFGTLRWIVESFKRRVILTGTPMPKNYLNIWPQIYLVDRGHSLGTTFTGYKNNHFVPSGYMGYNWELRKGEDKIIQRKISHLIHRVERDTKVPIQFVDLRVKLPPKAMLVYKELEREFISEWRGKTLIAANAAVATNKLRQAANGAIYYKKPTKGKKRQFVVLHKRKVQKLAELVDDLKVRGHSLLTAYEFDHDYQTILDAGLKVPSYSKAKRGAARSELKQQWNRGELQHLCGQISSLSHGLNMQYGGHNLAYYGLTFNLDDYAQFYQRLWRDDQLHGVTAFRIIADDTIDELMLDVLHMRDADQNDFLKALVRRYDL